jgi:hypothetical protein
VAGLSSQRTTGLEPAAHLRCSNHFTRLRDRSGQHEDHHQRIEVNERGILDGLMPIGCRWLLLPLSVTVVAVGCGNEVDKDAYVERNRTIVQSLPVFPEAKQLGMRSSPYRDPEKTETDQTTVGYITTVAYGVPRGTKTRAIENFYKRRLRGWRLVEDFGRPVQAVSAPRTRERPSTRQGSGPILSVAPIPVFSYDRGDSSVSVNLDNVSYGKFDVVVDHDHYGENKYKRPGK